MTSDSSPSFSWSGEKIVFCRCHKFLNNDAGANNWDQADVYIINRNATGLLRLTRGNYELMIRPHFYPGDDSVLFDTLHIDSNPWQMGNSQGGLARVSTSGTGQPVALKFPVVDGDMYGWSSFTPDGKHIIYSINRSGTVGIYRAASDGNNASLIKTGGIGSGLLCPEISHDGKRIYYIDREERNMWEMDVNGTNAHRIVANDSLSDVSNQKSETE